MRKLKITVLICSMLLLGACNSDIEEFRFTGHVVDGWMCSSSQMGYIIDIFSSEDLGIEYTINGNEYSHAVIGYKSPKRLYQDDTITGVAYMTKSYAALNCFGIIDKDLPEMIILSIE